jgi:hypothetical protein
MCKLNSIIQLAVTFKKYINESKRSYIVGGPDKMKARACRGPYVDDRWSSTQTQNFVLNT